MHDVGPWLRKAPGSHPPPGALAARPGADATRATGGVPQGTDARRDTWRVSTISIPPRLADALTDDADPARVKWLEALPEAVAQIASDRELELGEPFLPGGVCAWVARARNAARS